MPESEDRYLYRNYQYRDGRLSRMAIAYRIVDKKVWIGLTTTSPEDFHKYSRIVARRRSSGHLDRFMKFNPTGAANHAGGATIELNDEITDPRAVADLVGEAITTWLVEARAGAVYPPEHVPHRLVREFDATRFYRSSDWDFKTGQPKAV